MAFDRAQSLKIKSMEDDTLYYGEMANFTEYVWSDRCKSLDELWEALIREDAQIRECAKHIECSIFGTSGESRIILPELQNNLDKVKELSEYWSTRKEDILAEIDQFKAEALEICENFHRDVRNAKFLAEKCMTSSKLEQNKIGKTQMSIRSSRAGRIVGGIARDSEIKDSKHASKKLKIVRSMEYPPNPEVQTIRCVPGAKGNSNAQINVSLQSNSSSLKTIPNTTWYENTFPHHIASKRRRIDKPVAVKSRSYSTEVYTNQIRKIFVKHFDKMMGNMCRKMDVYFDEMRVHNNTCKQILNNCIQTIWTGETYTSFTEKLTEICNRQSFSQ